MILFLIVKQIAFVPRWNGRARPFEGDVHIAVKFPAIIVSMSRGIITKMFAVELGGFSDLHLMLRTVLTNTGEDPHILNARCVHSWRDLGNPFTCNNCQVIYIIVARYLRDGIL